MAGPNLSEMTRSLFIRTVDIGSRWEFMQTSSGGSQNSMLGKRNAGFLWHVCAHLPEDLGVSSFMVPRFLGGFKG